MYNLWLIAGVVYYLFLLFELCDNERNLRKLIVVFIVFFAVYSGFNFFSGQGAEVYNGNSYILGSVLIVIASTGILFNYLKADGLSIRTEKWSFILFVAGLILFYSATAVLMSTLNYLKDHNPRLTVIFFQIFNHGFNILLYTAFIVALVLDNKGKRNKQRSATS